MNKSQKRTFYSFLSLYLVSSYILLGTIAFFYYKSQSQFLHLKVHYELHEEANKIKYQLFSALDKEKKIDFSIKSDKFNIYYVGNDGITIGEEMISINDDVINGNAHGLDNNCLLYTKLPDYKHNVSGFLLVDKMQADVMKEWTYKIAIIFTLISILIAIFGYILSRLFFKPINNYIEDLNEFIKDVNHELNTPITALMMASSQLEKNYDKRLVKSVTISTKQLYDIYKSLIEINFEQKSEKTNLNLKEVLTQSIEYFNEISTSKRIELIIDINDFEYLGNKDKMLILFNNLISNAIKYSNPNSKVMIFLNKEGVFYIKDEGIGIEKHLQDKVFTRFTRVTTHAGGFGIGLDVVKKISDEYKIKIVLDSEHNIGTKIYLYFK